MYVHEVPKLMEIAAEPEGLAAILKFTLLSIRQPFGTLDAATRDVKVRGHASAYIWGWKRQGFAYIDANALDISGSIVGEDNTAAVIDYLACFVPGFGIVKSAFVAQMLGHEVACFDSRNLELCEMPRRAFREFKGKELPTPETRLRRISEYIAITRDTGGAEHWWNTWCNGIAPSLGMTGDEVSRAHVRYVERLI